MYSLIRIHVLLDGANELVLLPGVVGSNRFVVIRHELLDDGHGSSGLTAVVGDGLEDLVILDGNRRRTILLHECLADEGSKAPELPCLEGSVFGLLHVNEHGESGVRRT